MTDYKILVQEMTGGGATDVITVWASEIRGAATIEEAVGRFVQGFGSFRQDFGPDVSGTGQAPA